MTSTVIFVPGIKGSELMEGAIRRWPSLRESDIERLNLNTGARTLLARDVFRRLQLGPIWVNVYGPLLEDFSSMGATVRTFPYDWRRDILELVEDFSAFVRSVVAEVDHPITLVCHSMGGLLAKAYLLSQANPDKFVQQVITLGTPWHGAPEAYKQLRFGEVWPAEQEWQHTVAYASSFTPLSKQVTPATFAMVAKSCPAAYQLLPSKAYCDMCPDNGYVIPGGVLKPLSYDDVALHIDSSDEFGNANNFTRYAVTLHNHLCQPWPANIGHYAVVGYGVPTVGQVVEEPQYYLKRYEPDGKFIKAGARWIDGDKIVPCLSAIPPVDHSAVIRYVEDVHAALPKNRAVRTWIRNILTGASDLDVIGLYPEIVPDNTLKAVVTVSCPVDIGMTPTDGDGGSTTIIDGLHELPSGVLFYHFGETRYFVFPADREYQFKIDSFGSGPLNVGVTHILDGEVVKNSQFSEVELDPKTSARLSVAGANNIELEVTSSPDSVEAVLRPETVSEPERLKDKVPPKLRIVVEPPGGGEDVGKVGHGRCLLRLEATDDHTDVLDSFYRLNGGAWRKYPRHPVAIDRWGKVDIEAYATDLLRNKPPKVTKRSVRIMDTDNSLRLHLEYTSGTIRAYLRTIEGIEPESDLLLEYRINSGVPKQYNPDAAIDLQYNSGEVRLAYRVHNLDYPGVPQKTLSIATDGLQQPIWGNGLPLTYEDISRLLGEHGNPDVEVRLDGEIIGPHVNIHAYLKANRLELRYRDITYTFHLRPTYHCYDAQGELIPYDRPSKCTFRLYEGDDEDNTVVYPEIMVKLFAKSGKQFKPVRTIMPTVVGAQYEYTIDPFIDLPSREKVIKLEYHDFRRLIKDRVVRLM